MDDKTNLTPEQDEVQTGEEVSFTISGEDAAAQEALNAKKTAKKKSPLPWIIGGAAVVIAAAITLILTLKPKTVSPDAEQPGDATISEPAGTPDGTDSTQPDDQTPAEDGQTGEQADGEETEPAGNGISYTVEADALTDRGCPEPRDRRLRRRPSDEPGASVLLLAAVLHAYEQLRQLRLVFH